MFEASLLYSICRVQKSLKAFFFFRNDADNMASANETAMFKCVIFLIYDFRQVFIKQQLAIGR